MRGVPRVRRSPRHGRARHRRTRERGCARRAPRPDPRRGAGHRGTARRPAVPPIAAPSRVTRHHRRDPSPIPRTARAHRGGGGHRRDHRRRTRLATILERAPVRGGSFDIPHPPGRVRQRRQPGPHRRARLAAGRQPLDAGRRAHRRRRRDRGRRSGQRVPPQDARRHVGDRGGPAPQGRAADRFHDHGRPRRDDRPDHADRTAHAGRRVSLQPGRGRRPRGRDMGVPGTPAPARRRHGPGRHRDARCRATPVSR